MIFFTSDYHFGHANIIKYCKRPFRSVQEMDDQLIANTNDNVTENDWLYFNGDWCFSNRSKPFAEAAKFYRDRIVCRNIVFIWGNHDERGFNNYPFMKMFRGCNNMLNLKFDRQKITLCHWAMNLWHSSHHGAWHLYGHSHGTYPENPNSLSFDVGVDAIAQRLSVDGVLKPEDYRPISIDEVGEIMSKKNYKPVDRHGSRDEA